MVRRLGKALGWLFCGTFTLLLIAYAILYVANLNDQPPIPEIAILKSLQDPDATIVSDENSYLYILGFSAPPDADPMALGLERHAWIQKARPEFTDDGDPLPFGYDLSEERSDSVEQFAQTCSDSEVECLRLLQSKGETLEEWLTTERWLLDRYRTLLDMPEFREPVPIDLLAPLPSYGVIFEAQRLHLADIWLSAAKSDAAVVNAALERDLVYWRMVLQNSDALITKMIAAAAVARHFKLGNLALRRLPAELAADGIPASWRRQISDQERSMKRSLAGEWVFFDESIRKVADEDPFGDWTGLDEATTWDRVLSVVFKPFWQRQELANQHALNMLKISDAFSVPYNEVPRAIDRANEIEESVHQPFSRLYNFTGDLVMFANYSSFTNYALRATDLEGIRRAALLASELRADGVAENQVADHLLITEIVDPYTNKPFTWDDEAGAIVFYGLEPYDRAKHKIIY